MEYLPKKLLPFFWHFIKRYPLAFATFFGVPILLVLETNLIPYTVKGVIDGVLSHENSRTTVFNTIAPYLWLGISGWATLIIAARLQHWWQSHVIPKFEADIRLSTLKYLTGHSYHYFSNQLSGTLANKIADLPRALDVIRMIMAWNVIGSTAIALVSITLMSMVSPVFGFIFAIWLSIQVGLGIAFALKVSCNSEKNANDKSNLSGAVVDTISNIASVKLFARRKYEMRYIGGYQDAEKASHKRLIASVNRLFLVLDISMTSVLVIMTYLLIQGWQRNELTTGDMIFVFNTFWALAFHMWFLGQNLSELFSNIGIAKQALSLISPNHEIVDKSDTPLNVSQGEITFDNVTFHYQRNHNLFENKHVTIKAGSKVGLVGFSGSGKTSFAHLILRFFDISSGHILIDGQNIADVTQDSLHEQITMIPQDTALFHRSLLENIRYGNLDATDEEVFSAAKQAHCDDFIQQLPEGYETLVGERGIKLSGGQRQRIAIARAILKNAPILILDEATSALDSVTEKQIQSGLQNLMKDRTTIVIAHRLSTLDAMDRILVFDKGHIIEDGTHKQLLKQKGHYARMWHMQAGGFLPEEEKI